MKRLVAACLALLATAGCSGKKAPAGAVVPAGGNSAAIAFRDLGVKGAGAKVKITFAVTGEDGRTSTVTVAQDPPRRSFRIKDGESETLLISSDAGDYIACGSDVCFSIPGLGSAPGAAGAAFLGPLTESFDVFKDVVDLPGFAAGASRTIAGRAATCASFQASFATGGVQECLDSRSGVALFIEATGGAGKAATFQATEVTQPAESDFTSPHPVESIPTSFPTGFETGAAPPSAPSAPSATSPSG